VPSFKARPDRLVSLSGTVTPRPFAVAGPVTRPSTWKVRACVAAGMAAARSRASTTAIAMTRLRISNML
jgi:hypothetical protein